MIDIIFTLFSNLRYLIPPYVASLSLTLVLCCYLSYLILSQECCNDRCHGTRPHKLPTQQRRLALLAPAVMHHCLGVHLPRGGLPRHFAALPPPPHGSLSSLGGAVPRSRPRSSNCSGCEVVPADPWARAGRLPYRGYLTEWWPAVQGRMRNSRGRACRGFPTRGLRATPFREAAARAGVRTAE
jgi:hypothetical protein